MVGCFNDGSVETCTNINCTAQEGHVFTVSDGFDAHSFVESVCKFVSVLRPLVLGDTISDEVVAVVAVFCSRLNVL
jgi:hypothetical protein